VRNADRGMLAPLKALTRTWKRWFWS
jgi:hypothetical protein